MITAFALLISSVGAAAGGSSSAVAATATGPALEAGLVSTLTAAGALQGVEYPSITKGGIAVIDGSAIVVDGSRLVRVDTTDGGTSVLAGVLNTRWCQDAAAGSDVRFWPYQDVSGHYGIGVAGAYSQYVYVSDGCGLRRVDVSTGATSTVTGTRYRYVTMSGHFLYGIDDSSYLWRHDLTDGSATQATSALTSPGPIAADDAHVWMISNGGGTLKRIDPSTGTATTVSDQLPLYAPASVMLSVGDYLYASFASRAAPNGFNTLLRIRKDTGGTLLVAPSGVGNDNQAFASVLGIASDDTKLYVADSATDSSWVKTVSAATPKAFADPADGPVVDVGLVSTSTASDALSGVSYASITTGGVAVADGSAVVVDGSRLIRVNTATGGNSVLAGASGSTSCQDATTGPNARFKPYQHETGFYGVEMAGSDGRFVYVSDGCGLRRVDPNNGATSTVTDTQYLLTAITGRMLYGVDRYHVVWRHDLAEGGAPTQVTTLSFTPDAMAADATELWLLSGSTLKYLDPSTGTVTTITTELPNGTPHVALSVGDYLYAGLRLPGGGTTVLIRISKDTGAAQTMAGVAVSGHVDGGYTNAQFSAITGIAADGTSLLVSDAGTTQSHLRMVRTPETSLAGKLIVPEGNPLSPNSGTSNGLDVSLPGFDDPVINWDPQTHLCTGNCEEIYQERQRLYEAGGSYTWWHAVRCTATDCTPQDYERDIIEKAVDNQRIFNQDGTLRADWVANYLLNSCWESAATPSTSCSGSAINSAAEPMDRYDRLAQDIATFIAGLPGGLRPNLTKEQKDALTKYQELAKKACQEVPRAPGQSAQSWGTAVHTKFNEFVQAEGNPKMFGETGYFGRQPVPGGAARPKGSSYPDGVFGTDILHPEMLVDLKTGLKLIQQSWVLKLGGNLPSGYTNIPVFNLTC